MTEQETKEYARDLEQTARDNWHKLMELADAYASAKHEAGQAEDNGHWEVLNGETVKRREALSTYARELLR